MAFPEPSQTQKTKKTRAKTEIFHYFPITIPSFEFFEFNKNSYCAFAFIQDLNERRKNCHNELRDKIKLI